MLDVGVRIELYETVGAAGEPSTGYGGALVSDHHFQLEAAPRVGELVSMTALATSRHRQDAGLVTLEDPRHGPFFAVRQVEHYLAPADPDRASPMVSARPGPVLVFHAELPHPDVLPELVTAYHGDGWAVMAGNDPDRPLRRAWEQVIVAAG